MFVWPAQIGPACWALCSDDSLLFTQAPLARALGGYQASCRHQRLAGLQALQAQFGRPAP